MYLILTGMSFSFVSVFRNQGSSWEPAQNAVLGRGHAQAVAALCADPSLGIGRMSGSMNEMDDGSGTANGMRFGITEAAHHGDERTALLGVLQRQRDLVAWKLRGVPDEILSVATTPTGMSLSGLVRHLTNVERSWLRDVFADQQGLEYDWTEQDPEAEWRVPAGTKMPDLLTDYAAESRQCDAVVTAAPSLDDVSVQRDISLRWILLHLIEETARHLGHIDVLREQVDGSTGEEPTQ
jgi:hypothetical protein